MKYRANPVIVNALKIENVTELSETGDLGQKIYGLDLEGGEQFKTSIDMTARMRPSVGDYVVWQEDGYVYLNPKAVFEKKYSPVAMVSSSCDQRVTNNVMRHNYRVLNEEEKQQMQGIKDMGMQFYNYLHGIGGTNMDNDKFASRELSLAATKIEEAVMWAVKHTTR